MSHAMQNLHVPLPADLYQAFRAEAARQGLPATRAAREAIRRWIEERRRAEVERRLEAYIQRAAGSTEDLDPVLEAAAVEHLIGPGRARRKKRAR